MIPGLGTPASLPVDSPGSILGRSSLSDLLKHALLSPLSLSLSRSLSSHFLPLLPLLPPLPPLPLVTLLHSSPFTLSPIAHGLRMVFAWSSHNQSMQCPPWSKCPRLTTAPWIPPRLTTKSATSWVTIAPLSHVVGWTLLPCFLEISCSPFSSLPSTQDPLPGRGRRCPRPLRKLHPLAQRVPVLPRRPATPHREEIASQFASGIRVDHVLVASHPQRPAVASSCNCYCRYCYCYCCCCCCCCCCCTTTTTTPTPISTTNGCSTTDSDSTAAYI